MATEYEVGVGAHIASVVADKYSNLPGQSLTFWMNGRVVAEFLAWDYWRIRCEFDRETMSKVGEK